MSKQNTHEMQSETMDHVTGPDRVLVNRLIHYVKTRKNVDRVTSSAAKERFFQALIMKADKVHKHELSSNRTEK